MDELRNEIQLAFDSINLILVFVTALFSLRYADIRKDIDQYIPSGSDDKKKHWKKLRNRLLGSLLPLFLINGVTVFLFLPTFLKILTETRFNLVNFDFTISAFVIISVYILGIFLWCGYLGLSLIKRMKMTSKN